MTVSVVTADDWDALCDLFGRAGASNGCWCQYWFLGPEYHRRDRAINRGALREELSEVVAPGPGLVARDAHGRVVGWARLTPRAELAWLRSRFGRALPDDDDVWSMPCFFVRVPDRGRGVMSALIAAGIDTTRRHDIVALEAYPVDPAVPGATRNRFTGVLPQFVRAGFVEVGRISADRAVVRHEHRA